MSNQTTQYKNKFNSEHYDHLRIVVPKGRKAVIDAYAKQNGQSVNGLVNELLRERIGLTEAQWKAPEKAE